MPKRKASSATSPELLVKVENPVSHAGSKRKAIAEGKAKVVNPSKNKAILDATDALRASPGASARDDAFKESKVLGKRSRRDTDKMSNSDDGVPSLTNSLSSESELSEIPEEVDDEPLEQKPKKVTSRKTVQPSTSKVKQSAVLKDAGEEGLDADEDGVVEDAGEIHAASLRPPPVNSEVLPLPWKGRLGYACLNTYLRFSNPPVFASRTCRIASILENRHPLKFPNEPPHPTKNRPDKDQPSSIERGQKFVESLGLANARDCIKMLRWNDRYGIKFLRLSSEMFPFASHEEYGYKLAPFASAVLGEVGKTAAELGHRLTTHPGQFTQLGSPRKVVIDNAIRDLDYHQELLSLLKLPDQQDRDAVMIMHLGGVFGDKDATIQRFRENYNRLSPQIKKRLVLENDDVSYSVHDLLPLCEELNIPLVLDFHHHNIVFDADKIREGTKDIVDLFPRIIATWRRKNITPKMHYSEQTPSAITPMKRRKHSPRVATLPPCPNDMDLMIEAKDKEQAVFELMKTFRLPGFDTFSNIIPHVRQDENKSPKPTRSKAAKQKHENEDPQQNPPLIPEEEVGMGGPEGRVYWPPGMEEWLRPAKRVTKKDNQKAQEDKGPAKRKGVGKKSLDEEPPSLEDAEEPVNTPKPRTKAKAIPKSNEDTKTTSAASKAQGSTPSKRRKVVKGNKSEEKEEELDESPDLEIEMVQRPRASRRASRKKVDYTVDQSE